MKLIEDLGLIYMTDNAKRKMRCGIYKCPNCGKVERLRDDVVRKKKYKTCNSCAKRTVALELKNNLSHGLSSEPLYRKFNGIKSRCYNKNDKMYKYYGAKKVTICQEWLDDFSLFHKWAIENGYKEGLHLDKDILCERDNISPKIYSPSTCLFITASENSIEANKRRYK